MPREIKCVSAGAGVGKSLADQIAALDLALFKEELLHGESVMVIKDGVIEIVPAEEFQKDQGVMMIVLDSVPQVPDEILVQAVSKKNRGPEPHRGKGKTKRW